MQSGRRSLRGREVKKRNASLVTRTSFEMLNAKLIHTVGFINKKQLLRKSQFLASLGLDKMLFSN